MLTLYAADEPERPEWTAVFVANDGTRTYGTARVDPDGMVRFDPVAAPRLSDTALRWYDWTPPVTDTGALCETAVPQRVSQTGCVWAFPGGTWTGGVG